MRKRQEASKQSDAAQQFVREGAAAAALVSVTLHLQKEAAQSLAVCDLLILQLDLLRPAH